MVYFLGPFFGDGPNPLPALLFFFFFANRADDDDAEDDVMYLQHGKLLL